MRTVEMILLWLTGFVLMSPLLFYGIVYLTTKAKMRAVDSYDCLDEDCPIHGDG